MLERILLASIAREGTLARHPNLKAVVAHAYYSPQKTISTLAAADISASNLSLQDEKLILTVDFGKVM